MNCLICVDTVDCSVLGIPAYFFCAFVGFVITTCSYIMMMAWKKYDISQSVKTLYISLVGMAVGAKLFGCLTGIYRDVGLGKPITAESLADTGIVYYGGLIGLIAVYYLCVKSKRSTLDAYSLDVLAVCFPLFHAIARIGCFLSGCCFGIVHNGFPAVYYAVLIDGIDDVNMRFPVQLLEALFELTLFIHLFSLLRKKDWYSRKILVRYLSIYSIGRFFLEFLRGDLRRGIIHGVSFSQCISFLIWIALVGLHLKQIKKIDGGL